jgi:PAS domain S-box-containing protein
MLNGLLKRMKVATGANFSRYKARIVRRNRGLRRRALAVDVHREADRLVLAAFAPPGVVISDDLSIIQFRGETGPFLAPSPGSPSFDLLRMVREELRLPLRQLIDEVRVHGVRARKHGLPLGVGDEARTLELDVIPFVYARQRFFVVLFRELAHSERIETTRAERAEQAAQGFRDMLMQATQAIMMTAGQGEIVFANHMAAETFGRSPEELLTLTFEALLPERLREEHRERRANFLRYPQHRESYRDVKTFGLRKDGSEFPALVSLGSMLDGGKPLVVSFIRDVTLQHVAERQIRQYEARLKRMAFDAAITEERERRRIAADLHDGVGQALALARIKLTGIRDSSTENRAGMDEVIELLTRSVLDTRTLTTELSPPMLYDLGIRDALSWLAEDVERRQGIQVELSDDDSPKPLDELTAALVYRAVRELLMNVFKHAKCSKAHVALRREGDELEIDVVDAGVGFAVGDPTSHSSGFGLFNVREQISRLGGTISVVATPGHGTHVSLRVPMRPPT